MKISIKVSIFGVIGASSLLGLASCSEGISVGSAASAPPRNALSASDASLLQVSASAPCLSFPKLAATVDSAKRLRTTKTDINIATSETSPLSQAFIREAVDETSPDPATPMVSQDESWTQTDCAEAILSIEGGKYTFHMKLLEATATRLTMAPADAQLDDQGLPADVRVSIELVGPSQLAVKTSSLISAKHEPATCGLAKEQHLVTVTGVTDFGDVLPDAPAGSMTLLAAAATAGQYDDPAMASQKQSEEAKYCAKVKALPPAPSSSPSNHP